MVGEGVGAGEGAAHVSGWMASGGRDGVDARGVVEIVVCEVSSQL